MSYVYTTIYTTPLIEAVKANHIVECRRLIESEGVDVHKKDIDGRSPIIWGCLRGCLDIVELLLSTGANIHDKENNGRSSIIWASFSGHLSVVDLLSYSSHPSFSPCPYRKHGLLYRLRKWPSTMAILVLTELALIYRIDCSSLIDLHQYIGREDFTFDVEEDYTL